MVSPVRRFAAFLLSAIAFAPHPAGAADPPARPLTRDEALRTAATQNLGKLADALDIASAEASLDIAYGAYVPTLDVEGKLTEVPGEARRAVTVSPTVVASSPVGTSLTAGIGVSEALGDNPAWHGGV